MDIVLPNKTTITIYSKSECKNCLIIKDLFTEQNIEYIEINCDKYLIDNIHRQEFINKLNIDTSNIIFPIVFDKEKLIGNYKETINFLTNTYKYNDDF